MVYYVINQFGASLPFSVYLRIQLFVRHASSDLQIHFDSDIPLWVM